MLRRNLSRALAGALFAATLLGAGNAAQAQSTGAYLISEINYRDKAYYQSDYSPKIRAVYAQYGGVFIVGTDTVATMESTTTVPQRVVVARFESMERARAFMNSKERADLVPVRDRAAQIRTLLVEGR
jgi:uncharacterized protein (DUF1330 family)